MIKNCKICNKEFATLNTRKIYCSLQCQYKFETSKSGSKVCPHCNREFQSKHKEAKCFSHTCSVEHWRSKKLATSYSEIANKRLTDAEIIVAQEKRIRLLLNDLEKLKKEFQTIK